jgi:hypothetical protein
MPKNVTKAHYWYMGDISTSPMVIEIARGLVAEGRHETRVELGNRQALVDAGWAARQAGQLLGRRVRVTTSRSTEPDGAFIVTVVLADR